MVDRGLVSPPINVKLTLSVIPCNFFWGGLSIYRVAVTITYQVEFSIIQISIIHENMSSRVANKRR